MRITNSVSDRIVASQLYYTSCRHGLSGHPGFQTRAMSHSIQPEQQRSMERLGVFQPPRNCPVEPQQREIEDLFPVAFRNIVLETGELVVSRSCYVGKDYSGRWGNYFSHVLLINQLPVDIWPIDCYEWTGWKRRLEDEEDTSNTAGDLLETTVVPNSRAYSFGELQDFLREEESRADYLKKMIQAALLRAETSRSLIIREEMENNGIFWIACIQKSFPSTRQSELTCSSYQFDPRAALAVNVVHGDTDFHLGENERKFQFFVFDFLNDAFSDLDSAHEEYASVVSSWMRYQPEKLRELHKFSHKFDSDATPENLLLMLRLFRIRIRENLELADNELLDLSGFVISMTKAPFLESMLDNIMLSLKKAEHSNNPNLTRQLAEFFTDAAIKTNSAEIRASAYQQIVNLIDSIIFDKADSVSSLESLRKKGREHLSSFDQDISSLLLSDKHLELISTHLVSLDEESLSFTANEIVTATRSLNKKGGEFNDIRFLRFIELVIQTNLSDLSRVGWLFQPFDNSPRNSATLFLYVVRILERTQEQYDIAIKSFSQFASDHFKKSGGEYRYYVINAIKSHDESWRLLEEEWKITIGNHKEKRASHKEYYQKVLEQDSEFAKEYRPEFAQNLWNELKTTPKERSYQALEWIKSGHINSVLRKLLPAIFEKAAEDISFKRKDKNSDALLELLDTRLRELDFNFNAKPNRLVLRKAVIFASEKAATIDPEQVGNVKTALSGIEKKDYQEFLANYLSPMLMKAKTVEQHGEVIDSILMEEQVNVFLHAYEDFFSQGKRKQFSNPESLAFRFWVSLNSDNENYRRYQSVRLGSIAILASRIAKLKDHAYKTLVHVIKSDKNFSASNSENLNELMQIVEQKKNTLFKRAWNKGSETMRKLNHKLGKSDV